MKRLLEPSDSYSAAHERLRNARIEDAMRRDAAVLAERLQAQLLPACTVAQLPSGVGAGVRGFATDALSPAFAAPVSGSGSVGVPVYYDGATWRCG